MRAGRVSDQLQHKEAASLRAVSFMSWLLLPNIRTWYPLSAEAKIWSFPPASRCCLGELGHSQGFFFSFFSFSSSFFFFLFLLFSSSSSFSPSSFLFSLSFSPPLPLHPFTLQAEVVIFQVSPCKALTMRVLLSPFHTVPFGRKSLRAAHTSEGKGYSPPRQWLYCDINYSQSFCT